MSDRINQSQLSKLLIEVFQSSKKFFENLESFNFKTTYKPDNSPLTILDKKIDFYIKEELNKFRNDFSVISEESGQKKLDSEYLWIIDSIDGTKELISGSDEFTVNIALIQNKRPIFGGIYQPLKDTIFLGGSDLSPIKIKGTKTLALKNQENELCNIVISKSHSTNREREFYRKVLSNFGQSKILKMGSSLKFCSICDGKADFYPRFGNINSWDIAAGHAILKAFGGNILDLDLNEISYELNKNQLIKGFYAFSSQNRLNFLREKVL